MGESRGIEVFGRRASVVDTAGDPRGRRTVAGRLSGLLGWLSVLLGVATVAATTFGVLAVTSGDPERARWLAYAAIGCGVAGAVVGLAAIVMGRSRGAGVVGLLLSVLGNPLVLTLLLGAVSSATA